MPKELWNNVLSTLKAGINKQSFNMWLKDTEPLSINGNVITIRVVDDVARRHIVEQYTPAIVSTLKEITGLNYTCEFISTNGFSTEKTVVQSSPQIPDPAAEIPEKSKALNPKYTFDNFVVGPNNQLAHAASRSIARAPATQYNPLFIYGGTGLGKTHLMHAIGHYIISEKPFLKVLYVTSEQFINDFISSIRTNTTASFKIKYRNVDILLIDDIQFIEKKEETQNEFFHTFNSLYENKKQIVISSDRPPKHLSTLEDRLKTRFEMGMITDIQPPNLETREAILRNKAEKEKIPIPDEVLNFIAKRIRSNIRALEAALNRLNFVSSVNNEPITIPLAKNHLKDLFDDDMSKKITLKDIMVKVSESFNISTEDIISKGRHARVIVPRFVAMYLCRHLMGMTTIEIGKEFGDRDHSTVVNAINKIEEDMNNNSAVREQVDDLITELKS